MKLSLFAQYKPLLKSIILGLSTSIALLIFMPAYAESYEESLAKEKPLTEEEKASIMAAIKKLQEDNYISIPDSQILHKRSDYTVEIDPQDFIPTPEQEAPPSPERIVDCLD